MRMNLPNRITVGRFALTLVLLYLLTRFDWRTCREQAMLVEACFWIFIVAAVSDILDGYLARRQNQVTSFGRILDPFVDKILVCGSFVLLLGDGFVDSSGVNVTGLSAWMVVLIVARELLVSGLRGFAESRGTPYAANYWGKAKMVVQSVTVPTILKSLGPWREVPAFLALRNVLIWLTVAVTALSVIAYLSASREALSERARG
jgi:CDP-diacylglycerol--glycerol-3-phosphate 3-phosphatidyltransferase